jgi:ABC-type uncharacterized transport system permease subunit
VIPGRVRGGPWVLVGNAVLLVALFTGTYLVAMGSGASPPVPAWSPWSGDIILVAAGLLFLGLGFLLPLHAGLMNLGIHGQFLVGFVAGSLVTRNAALEPWAQACLALLAGAVAGAGAGVVTAWLKRKFAVHEILSGLLLAGALVPIARVFGAAPGTPPELTITLGPLANTIPWTPGLELPPSFVLAWGILLLSTGLALGLTASHLLRASVRGFELRAVGSNPLAAVAAGVDVDSMQTLMSGLGGACAGLVGALQLWSNPAVALERWPVPLGFAGITVALLGAGHLRGAIAAALVLAVWLHTPGVPAALAHPAWGAAVAFLLVLPVLWNVPRLVPEQGAPRAVWRTRHREMV